MPAATRAPFEAEVSMMKPPLRRSSRRDGLNASGESRRSDAGFPDLGVLDFKARLGCSGFAGALQPCAERSHGVLLMTARSSGATLEAADKQGGAP